MADYNPHHVVIDDVARPAAGCLVSDFVPRRERHFQSNHAR